jgi:hypothetical protein
MARIGRPRTPAATIRFVRELLGCGFTQAAIVAELARLGKPLSRFTVRGIDEEFGPLDPELAEGETRVAPCRCDRGHLVTILPCRSCVQMPNRQLLDRLAASEAKAEQAGFSLGVPRAARHKRDYELLQSDLKPAEQARLEEVRAKRRIDEG